jgi:hypothetical protein
MSNRDMPGATFAASGRVAFREKAVTRAAEPR